MVDHTGGNLEKELEWAESIQEPSLKEIIAEFKRREERDARLQYNIGTDFAPHSFTFWNTINGEFYMNGGIIYHGQHGEHTSGPPTFSCTIGKAKGWEVHT